MTLEEIRSGAVLLFDKPFNWSSFDVVNKVKRWTNAKAHAGVRDSCCARHDCSHQV